MAMSDSVVAARTATPRVSVIIPVHNGASTLEACLPPLLAHSPELAEVIVVDDRSTDGSGAVARALGATVITSTGLGPAAARNLGARHARGDILFFVDADVTVQSFTLQQVVKVLDTEPTLSAVFGSYDDEPSEPNFLSQYKNLFHHFTHQSARTKSSSFWAGCGAIRRQVFEKVGGFDEQRYQRASIEDIELGFRLNSANYQVRLDRELQVKHLKRWRTFPLLTTEIFDRARPWSTLIISNNAIPDDLNLRWSFRLSAVLVGILAVAIPFLALGEGEIYGIAVSRVALGAVLVSCAVVVILNRKFYLFLIGARGLGFTLRAVPLHLCYYFYSGVTFVVCWVWEQCGRLISARVRDRAL
jgi:glycosyltransferase involved in cell wall biosynthesis